MQILFPNKYRQELIRETCLAWMELSPGTAREMARYVQEITKCDLGKWRKTGAGMLSARTPAELWHSLRSVLPDFGDHDSDLQYLAREFPDLVFKRKKKVL